jgi:hypothetical protein
VVQEKPALGDEGSVTFFEDVVVLARKTTDAGEALLLDSGEKVVLGDGGAVVERSPAPIGALAKGRAKHANRWKPGMHWYGGRKITDVTVGSDWDLVVTLEDGVRLVVNTRDEVVDRVGRKQGLDPAKALAAFDEKAQAEEPEEHKPVVGDILDEASKAENLVDVMRTVAEALGPDDVEAIAEWIVENKGSLAPVKKLKDATILKRVKNSMGFL